MLTGDRMATTSGILRRYGLCCIVMPVLVILGTVSACITIMSCLHHASMSGYL